MAIDAQQAGALERLRADPKRFERYVSMVADRLYKTGEEAAVWIEQMYAEGRVDLVDAVVEGTLLEGGHIYHPEEPPRSLDGLTTS